VTVFLETVEGREYHQGHLDAGRTKQQ
jgi:hypothetical protein